MPKIEVSRSVNAPPATVFEMLTDLEGAPRRIPAIRKIEMLTPGPVGVGTRFRETRVMFGREASETMEFVAFEPGRSYTVTAFSCGTRYRTRFEVAPEGAGSRVTVTFEGTPESFAAKLMAPLFSFMKGMMVKCLEGDLDAIATAAENRGA
jgi:carbon monoxide dehydrogenase subunit G